MARVLTRGSVDFINIEMPAIPDLDIDGPVTATPIAEADLPGDNALLHCGMIARQPASCMASTFVGRYTRGGHFRSRSPHETIPIWLEVIVAVDRRTDTGGNFPGSI